MKLAVVTGGNKVEIYYCFRLAQFLLSSIISQGIGFEICKKLCQAGVKTIVACRNETLGMEAVNNLKAQGFEAEYRSLDISDDLSIGRFTRCMEEDYGCLDILVNNAGIAYKGSDPTPFQEQCEPTILTNFFGTLKVAESLLPLVRKSTAGRIVNIASMTGHLRILSSEELKGRFLNCKSLDELEGLIQNFVDDVKAGTHVEKGWANSNYGMSKLGVIALTRVMAHRETEMYPGTPLLITSCCPGYCATDMTSHKGGRTAEHGARTPAMLALANSVPNGRFFTDEAEVEW